MSISEAKLLILFRLESFCQVYNYSFVAKMSHDAHNISVTLLLGNY